MWYSLQLPHITWNNNHNHNELIFQFTLNIYTVYFVQTGFSGDNVEWPVWIERRFIQVRPRGVGPAFTVDIIRYLQNSVLLCHRGGGGGIRALLTAPVWTEFRYLHIYRRPIWTKYTEIHCLINAQNIEYLLHKLQIEHLINTRIYKLEDQCMIAIYPLALIYDVDDYYERFVRVCTGRRCSGDNEHPKQGIYYY